MAKVVFLIMSDDVKMDLALTMAANTVGTNRYEDFKVIFWGPAQERLLRLEGPARDNFEKLLRAGAIDSACINYARNKGIEQELTKIGIKLHPAGDRVAYYINNGYQVLVF
ncbi:hypothetical protein [Vulcanisaeta distributa]|uniref:hypothetical protein n=1 Tax=Vulcanisaeta distributa TaxID=164451 RepID=UPI0006D032CE|nr:hypothetical protein [Vulcanisaeta distributa]